MAHDDIPEDQQESYPCKCGGAIEPSQHIIAGYFGDPPDICCNEWSCNKCDFLKRQCDKPALDQCP